MTMEHALALLSASLPLTAGIFKFVPKRQASGENGSKYVTLREFDRHVSAMTNQFGEIKSMIRDVEMLIKSRS